MACSAVENFDFAHQCLSELGISRELLAEWKDTITPQLSRNVCCQFYQPDFVKV